MKTLREISWDLNSVDMEAMYTAGGLLTQYDVTRTLLPRVMSLLDADDVFIRKIAYRNAGRNIFEDYIPEFFRELRSLPPAETLQVLQSIRESFRVNGSPHSAGEQKRWMLSLASLGKEHQPAVFDLMTTLGKPGAKWVSRFLKENIQNLTIGSVAIFAEFTEPPRFSLVRTLAEEAARKKRDLLPYICGITEAQTVRHLTPFLRSGNWEERKEVAQAIGRTGIVTPTGIIRDVIADPDWRVKQALIDAVDISKSRFSSLQNILTILVADSHTRIRGSAERLVLRLGSESCSDTNLDTQRERIMKHFRKQLLKAAATNRDLDASWMGVDIPSEEGIPFIDEKEGDDAGPQPVGIGDLQVIEVAEEKESEASSSVISLREALMRRIQESTEQVKPEEDSSLLGELEAIAIDVRQPPQARFLSLLDRLSEKVGKAVKISLLTEHASDIEMSAEEMKDVIDALVKEGTIYMVDEEQDRVRRADIIVE